MIQAKFDNGLVRIYQADARELPLKDGTVHCCVTSPPYFGLRVYQTDDKRVLGLESSIEEYIGNLVDVFREVKRVLRDDGVLWVNIGDSYAGSGKGQNGDGTHAAKHGEKQHTSKGTLTGGLPTNSNHALEGGRVDQLPGGNLLGVPWRLALALQDDGWILRDAIVWSKASPMPESLAGWRWEQCRVKAQERPINMSNAESIEQGRYPQTYDPSAQWSPCPGCAKCEANDGLVLRKGSWRCTSSYEVIFMLVKSMGYWADGEAVKTQVQESSLQRVAQNGGNPNWNGDRERQSTQSAQTLDINRMVPADGKANRRNVWKDIHAEPYPGEHYATFPPDLPRICIQASTSEQGCCPKCGAQVTRVVQHMETKATGYVHHEDALAHGNRMTGIPTEGYAAGRSLGWRPSCGHQEAIDAPEPCLVLDPFIGTGTTGLAAMRLNRRCVGTDLSEEYIKQAKTRLSSQTLPMGMMK